MRIPKSDENLTGKVCIGSTGRIGIVTGRGDHQLGWKGIGFDGKGNWSSSSPVVAYETAKEFRLILKERFNGRMSHIL